MKIFAAIVLFVILGFILPDIIFFWVMGIMFVLWLILTLFGSDKGPPDEVKDE